MFILVFILVFELDYLRTLLAALHVHRIEIPHRAFPEQVGPRILSLESVHYFGTTDDHFSGRKKLSMLYSESTIITLRICHF